MTEEYYFLEVNPRLQVEHTITESISMTDIVKAQLLLAQGAKLDGCGLPKTTRDPEVPPPAHSIQLRITAENVQSDWSLSIGKITSFQFPTGNGIRIDTHLISGHPAIVSADFDSLIAKLIITASSWPDCVHKAQRALADTSISGVKTNIDILRGIVAHPDFLAGHCDTQWLERNQTALLQSGLEISATSTNTVGAESGSPSSAPALSSANTLFRKGDAWSLSLTSPDATAPAPHHLELTRVLRNDFPSSLSAEILFTSPPSPASSNASQKPTTTPYTLTLTSTTASAAAATSHHRRANPGDASHVAIPFPGKLVEVLVDEGDVVREGDVVCVVQQMKMELEVRSPRSGRVAWVMEVEDGEDVGEGVLAAVIESDKEARL
jgi:pyruvate carboxylase